MSVISRDLLLNVAQLEVINFTIVYDSILWFINSLS
jgi:hypothetical protein